VQLYVGPNADPAAIIPAAFVGPIASDP
jgi:hypothetical protein